MPIIVEQKWIDEIKKSLPELPDIKRKRFVAEYALPEYDADLLISEKPLADWFEEAVKLGGQPKIVANWVKGDLMRLLNEDNKSIEDCPLKPKQLVDMLKLIDNGTISGKIAKTVFEEMYKTNKITLDVTLPMLKVKMEMQEGTAKAIVKEKGLVQISDTGEIDKAIDDVIAKNPKEVDTLQAGEEKLIRFLCRAGDEAYKRKSKPSDGE